jgi:ABC-type transport system involved in cytochrome bd biosynthesis fused ATPase/permease subunit
MARQVAGAGQAAWLRHVLDAERPPGQARWVGWSGRGADGPQGIRFEAPAGRVTAMVGPSGAGKSILVLDGGRLVEQGRHAELLARGGVYATLWQCQQQAQQWQVGAAEP